jgi:hypothetical protein
LAIPDPYRAGARIRGAGPAKRSDKQAPKQAPRNRARDAQNA